MSIQLWSITAMFSFTKVENWRTVNFLPKCTRWLHQIVSQNSKLSRGDTADPYPWGGDTLPLPRPLLHSALRERGRDCEWQQYFGHSITSLTVSHYCDWQALHKFSSKLHFEKNLTFRYSISSLTARGVDPVGRGRAPNILVKGPCINWAPPIFKLQHVHPCQFVKKSWNAFII